MNSRLGDLQSGGMLLIRQCLLEVFMIIPLWLIKKNVFNINPTNYKIRANLL